MKWAQIIPKSEDGERLKKSETVTLGQFSAPKLNHLGLLFKKKGHQPFGENLNSDRKTILLVSSELRPLYARDGTQRYLQGF